MIYYPPEPKEKNPAILLIHGWKGDEAGNMVRAKLLSSYGYITMTFELRGHGKSLGNKEEFSLHDFLDDTVKAYDELSSLSGTDTDNIAVIGASLGAYLAILLSGKRNIARLALRAPSDYPNEWFDKPLALLFGEKNQTIEWKEKRKSFEETYALSALHQFNKSLLIIESENDTVIPHQTIQNYLDVVEDQNMLSFVLMKGASHHLDDTASDVFMNILVDWLK